MRVEATDLAFLVAGGVQSGCSDRSGENSQDFRGFLPERLHASFVHHLGVEDQVEPVR